MTEDYKEALVALHGALAELKGLANKCEDKINSINIILEKQGLVDWEAGATVNKDFCKDSHDGLVCDVKLKIKDLKDSLDNRFKWSWVVSTFILGMYGTVLFVLMQEVF